MTICSDIHLYHWHNLGQPADNPERSCMMNNNSKEKYEQVNKVKYLSKFFTNYYNVVTFI